MSMEWEFEEPEPVPASHLVKTRCRSCGAETLSMPQLARDASCGPCLAAEVGAGFGVAELLGKYGTPAGDALQRTPAGLEPLYVPEGRPEPSVTSREPWPVSVPVPGPVSAVLEYGRQNGWRAQRTYGRGYAVRKYRGAWQPEETIAVRFGREQRACFAVYRTIADRGAWSWRSMWLSGQDLPPFELLLVADLYAFLSSKPDMSPEAVISWQEDVLEIRKNGAVLKAEQDANKAEIKRMRAAGAPLDAMITMADGWGWTREETIAMLAKITKTEFRQSEGRA